MKTYQGKPCNYGHEGIRYMSSRSCIACTAIRREKWKNKNRPAILAIQRRHRQKHSKKITANIKHWRHKNPKKARAISATQYNKNKAYYIAAALIRQRKLRKRMLGLKVSDFKLIYEESQKISVKTGVKHHVDHIIPLNGKTVSGLHVPWNLQIIPAEANQRKYNFFNEEGN